ncbi:MAG: hypothetical protein QOD40_1887 [Alphaproteobacteria bacterium]|jgi:hypothetical protein|nr:hypothetical protein [Alphaproteobacteria bacterium]
MLVDVSRIDFHRLAVSLRRGEGNFVENALHHRLQPPRAERR